MRQNPHGGDIYTKKCRVDFSVNVNPLGAPESVKEAVRKSAESVEQYPDALCRDLTRALSEKEQLQKKISCLQTRRGAYFCPDTGSPPEKSADCSAGICRV